LLENLLSSQAHVGFQDIDDFLKCGFEKQLDHVAANEGHGAGWLQFGAIIFTQSYFFLVWVPLSEGEPLEALQVLHLLSDNIDMAARDELPRDSHVSNL
jgi:hypothetical protein